MALGDSFTLNQLHPVETQRASEAIYEQIRELILSSALNPGDRLPSERHMMELMKRSRPTIREALRMLERDGYIRTAGGSNGAIVQQPSTKNVERSLQALMRIHQVSLKDLANMRLVTEVAAAGWAARNRTEEDLAELDGIVAKHLSPFVSHEQFADIDLDFHEAVGKASHNTVAVIITNVLSQAVQCYDVNEMNRLETEDGNKMRSKIVKMHRSILEAIRDQDEKEAEHSMKLHIEAFYADLHNDEA